MPPVSSLTDSIVSKYNRIYNVMRNFNETLHLSLFIRHIQCAAPFGFVMQGSGHGEGWKEGGTRWRWGAVGVLAGGVLGLACGP